MIGMDLTLQPVTIASGQSLSAVVSVGAQTVVGVVMPTGWDAADLTFQVSSDGGTTFREMYNSQGNPVQYQVIANVQTSIDPSVWMGVHTIKVRSGTLAVPVNQTASRTLTFITRPY
jgi:hypothetical protein